MYRLSPDYGKDTPPGDYDHLKPLKTCYVHRKSNLVCGHCDYAVDLHRFGAHLLERCHGQLGVFYDLENSRDTNGKWMADPTDKVKVLGGTTFICNYCDKEQDVEDLGDHVLNCRHGMYTNGSSSEEDEVGIAAFGGREIYSRPKPAPRKPPPRNHAAAAGRKRRKEEAKKAEEKEANKKKITVKSFCKKHFESK